MSAPTTLITADRTPIDSLEDITFVNSPLHIRLQNEATDNTILSATVYLWIWNGKQNKALGNPNFTLKKDKVSFSDTYINFQIADLIKSFLINPSNGSNTDQPYFAYNELEEPAITGQGVFWQIVSDIESTTGIVRHNYTTAFATLGYLWNYEQSAKIWPETSPNRYYNPKIHDYFSQDFVLTNSLSVATTENMITKTNVTPPAAWSKCSRDPYMIVFLNKKGLWEEFTPFGKVIVSAKVDSEIGNRSYRDPKAVDNWYAHSKNKDITNVTQSYTVNTGLLDQTMTQIVEQIIYSPKVYLIQFKGDLQNTSTVGITVDNTFITVDNTNITVDSATVTSEELGKYKTHKQIPVVVTDSDFIKKSRVNDKNSIEYTLKFEETNSLINNIR